MADQEPEGVVGELVKQIRGIPWEDINHNINVNNILFKAADTIEVLSAKVGLLESALKEIDEEDAPRLKWDVPTAELSVEDAYERGRSEVDEWLGDILANAERAGE